MGVHVLEKTSVYWDSTTSSQAAIILNKMTYRNDNYWAGLMTVLSLLYYGNPYNKKDSIYIDTATTPIRPTMPVDHQGSPANNIIYHLWYLSLNSLGPSDAIWRQRSGSTLVQVMACCLTAPSHHLNQCWLIISKIQLHSSDGNSTRHTSVISD